MNLSLIYILLLFLLLLLLELYLVRRLIRILRVDLRQRLALLADSLRWQWIGELRYRIKTDEKVVALTFDDGPYEPYTSELLQTLDELEVKATFFIIGQRMERFPGVVEKTLAGGHQVGNHSYSHLPLINSSLPVIREEIERVDILLQAAGVTQPIALRAPYVRKGILLPYLLWRTKRVHTVFDFFPDPRDWWAASVELVSKSIIDQTRPGSILVLHDGNARAAPHVVGYTRAVVQGLHQKGYRFVTVDELVAIERG